MSFRLLKVSVSHLKKDKVCLLLSFAPVFISSGMFYYLWKYIVFDFAGWLKNYIGVSESSWWVVSYVITIMIACLAAFLLSWFFVSVVSLISSPFLDIISSRVEKIHLGKELPSFSESFSSSFSKLGFILKNEFLKLGVVLAVSFISFLMNQTVVLGPIAYFLSAIIFSYTYLDYSFARVNMRSKDCTKFVRRKFIPLGLSGMIFLVLISIPVLNLFMLPVVVTYYTLYFVENSVHEEKSPDQLTS